MFSLDVDNRQYWITAKHILTGAEHPPYGSVTSQSVSLMVLDPTAPGQTWVPAAFTVIDTEKDVDIVVLAPQNLLFESPIPSVTASSDGAFFGGDCEFLGFAYGGGWHASYGGTPYWMPFVKRCTIAAGPSDIPGGMPAMPVVGPSFWVLDGINNEGFSGGPVIFRTGADQRIMAVISGYLKEPADVVNAATNAPPPANAQTNPTAPQPKETVYLNSGFIVAFDISYAIDAIHSNPIGPLVGAK
jgi:hypothetical protein